jgi:hypothetical protein
LNRRQSDKDFCLSFGENRSAHLERIEQQGVRIDGIVSLDMGDLAAASHEVIRSGALASSCQPYLTHLVYIFHFWRATLNKSVLSLAAKKRSRWCFFARMRMRARLFIVLPVVLVLP